MKNELVMHYVRTNREAIMDFTAEVCIRGHNLAVMFDVIDVTLVPPEHTEGLHGGVDDVVIGEVTVISSRHSLGITIPSTRLTEAIIDAVNADNGLCEAIAEEWENESNGRS